MAFAEVAFENAAQDFFTKNPRLAEKYLSPNLVVTLAAAMMKSRAQYPTYTNAKMCFDALVESGELVRTDGRNAKDDYDDLVQDQIAEVASVMDEVDRVPLTRQECEEFASLSPAQVQELYWQNGGVSSWRIRYDKAAAAWGFQIPAPPSTTPVGTSEDVRSRL